MLYAVRLLLSLSALSMTAAAPAQAPLTYPETRAEPLVEEQFGIAVADPYRWLENDVRTDPKVREWVTAQNQVTDAYLATLPGRDVFKAWSRWVATLPDTVCPYARVLRVPDIDGPPPHLRGKEFAMVETVVLGSYPYRDPLDV